MDTQLGAFVLHGLEPEEADAVQRHLADCAECRDEARSLAFTASLLALLTPEDFERLDGGPSHAARPSRRRRVVLGVAAAVLAGSASIGVAEVLNGGESSNPAVVHAIDPDTRVRAAVTMSGHGPGTRLHLTLTGAYPTGSCSLVARSGDGRSETVASWVADPHGSAEVDGSTEIPVGELSELQVLTDSGRLLVRIPLHGT